MEIFSFNIYSETLFEGKKLPQIGRDESSLELFQIILMAEPPAVYLYALELIPVLCAFSAFCKVCHSAKTKNYGINKRSKISEAEFLELLTLNNFGSL